MAPPPPPPPAASRPAAGGGGGAGAGTGTTTGRVDSSRRSVGARGKDMSVVGGGALFGTPTPSQASKINNDKWMDAIFRTIVAPPPPDNKVIVIFPCYGRVCVCVSVCACVVRYLAYGICICHLGCAEWAAVLRQSHGNVRVRWLARLQYVLRMCFFLCTVLR